MLDTPPAEIRTVQNTTILGADGITLEGLSNAIQAGYRMIDTAMVYGTHRIIAESIQTSGIDRNLFTIATKIPGSKLDINALAASTEAAVETCLKELDTQYIDIFYLHGPDAFQPEVLDTLQTLKAEGKIHQIGLSNATTEQVQAISNLYDIAVVQVEFNPYSWDDKLLHYCRENKIELVGYRPFRRDDSHAFLTNPTLVAIASKINTSVSELILGWVRQKGVVPIARANSLEHLESNLKPLDRPLTDEEMAAIDALNQNNPSCLWQQYSHPQLLHKSEQWLNSLETR